MKKLPKIMMSYQRIIKELLKLQEMGQLKNMQEISLEIDFTLSTTYQLNMPIFMKIFNIFKCLYQHNLLRCSITTYFEQLIINQLKKVKQSIMSNHSVESQYRALSTMIKFVVFEGFPAAFPSFKRGPAKDKIKKIDVQNMSDEQAMQKLIKFALNSLTKKERSKRNIQNILLGSWEKFVQVLKHLKIEVPELNSQCFKEAQEAIRNLICHNFAAETDKIWEEYTKTIKAQENLPAQKKFLDQLILGQKLIWKTGLKRLPAKEMIEEKHETEEIHESLPSTGVESLLQSNTQHIDVSQVVIIPEQEEDNFSNSECENIGDWVHNHSADSFIFEKRETFSWEFGSDNEDFEQ